MALGFYTDDTAIIVLMVVRVGFITAWRYNQDQAGQEKQFEAFHVVVLLWSKTMSAIVFVLSLPLILQAV